MKEFYIKPEMDIELVEVESLMAVSETDIIVDPDKPVIMDTHEFVWEWE